MKKLLIPISLIIITTIIYIFVTKAELTTPGWKAKLVSPAGLADKQFELSATPTFTPTPTPVVYNNSTDLKKEMDAVDPQVSSNDFNQLKDLINSF